MIKNLRVGVVLLVSFFYCSILFGQEKELSISVKKLKQKIESSEKEVKLKYLDSLCKLILFKSKYKFDSIAEQTIDLAFQLDAIKIALWHTSDLIVYHATRSGNPEKGLQLFEDFKKKSIKNIDYESLTSIYTSGADSYYFSGKLKESIAIYEEAEKYAILNKDSVGYAKIKMYKSGAYSDLGNYVKASKLLTGSTKIFERLKDTLKLLQSRNQLATLYSKIGFLKEATKEREEIIRLGRMIHNDGSLVPNLYNASLEQEIMGNEKSRIKYLKEAYNHVEEPNYNYGISSIIYYGLLSAYSENDSLIKATIFYNKIQSKYVNRKSIPFEKYYRSSLVDYFIAIKKFKKALKEAKWTLEKNKEIGEIRGRYLMEEKLSEIYDSLEDKEKSFYHYKQFTILKDSVTSAKKSKALSYYQTLYETQRKEFKIKEQESEILVLDQQNRLKKQWLVFGGIGLLFVFSFIYLIRTRNFTKKEKQNQELFSQELIKVQEKQRTKVARDLHDSVGQKLMLLTKKVRLFKDEGINHLAQDTLDELRGISRGLYPVTFEKIGITLSIENMINGVDTNTDLFFMTELDHIDAFLSKQKALHLYRIIQEALNNIVKHAKAKSVFVTIVKKENFLKTTIKDNGVGFKLTEKLNSDVSLGMKTIHERAKIIKSKLIISSDKGEGTTIELIIPIINE